MSATISFLSYIFWSNKSKAFENLNYSVIDFNQMNHMLLLYKS